MQSFSKSNEIGKERRGCCYVSSLRIGWMLSAIDWRKRERSSSRRYCGRHIGDSDQPRSRSLPSNRRKDNGHTRWPSHARLSIAFYRELPLQVGPGFPGGAAYCARSWQVLDSQYRAVGADIKSGRHICGLVPKPSSPTKHPILLSLYKSTSYVKENGPADRPPSSCRSRNPRAIRPAHLIGRMG
jgi:hypothetical protein